MLGVANFSVKSTQLILASWIEWAGSGEHSHDPIKSCLPSVYPHNGKFYQAFLSHFSPSFLSPKVNLHGSVREKTDWEGKGLGTQIAVHTAGKNSFFCVVHVARWPFTIQVCVCVCVCVCMRERATSTGFLVCPMNQLAQDSFPACS